MLTYHAGFDQAFANSGMALLAYQSDATAKTSRVTYVGSQVFHPTIKLGHKSDAIAFLEHAKFIKDVLHGIKADTDADVASIGMEGVALGAPGQAAARGGIFGVYALQAMQYADLIIISPKKVKLFITGNGNAEKEEIGEVILPKYGLEKILPAKYKNKTERIHMWDEVDAIAIAEIGLYAWRALKYGIDSVSSELNDNQLNILWSKEPVKKKHKSSPAKQFGICNRIDDFYIRKRD